MTLELQAAEPATVALESLRRDDALICRAKGVNRATVAEYADAMKAGTAFPPVVVFRDPKARAFDPERELSRLEVTLAALLERWPGDDVDGRERLRLALTSWTERVRQATADPTQKPARRIRASSAAVADCVEAS